MKDFQLTPNFKLSEFCPSLEVNDYQAQLLQYLAFQLQSVRDYLQQYSVNGKAVTIGISSGVRTMADYERLKKKGYHPSKTSDHFCGLQLDGKPTLGAADIYVRNCKLNYHDIAAKIIEWDKQGICSFGQIIYEKNPATGAEWIHLGNDPDKIFTERINITRKPYLMSLDNGKTYKEFK